VPLDKAVERRRLLYTELADVLTGSGFSLLLVSAYGMTGSGVGWGKGLLWGLAGFAAFTLAPGVGPPPELPGTQAAPLLDRQIWWSATALLTAGCLGLLTFRRQALRAVVAVALIALSHVIGAPQVAEHASVVPESLADRLAVAATITGLLFWICLDLSTGCLFQQFSRYA
jgi:cobalt transporter subunit CbtA